MTIYKTELVHHVATAARLNIIEAHRAIDAIFTGITAGLLMPAAEVRIQNFGSFVAVQRKAREGRNPKTGEKIDIAASVGVSFRAHRYLKDRLNPKRLVGPDRGRTEARRKQA